MCGIAGFWTADGLAPQQSVLGSMCEALAHRGPDGYGCYLDARVALGHRRLSIIDLEGGAQPLGNEDGTIQVVFNGEIYNFQDLRRELQQKGHRFATHSDTEVLVHLYEESGERMPELLDGMFAFAVWDRTRQALFLARDRFGKKPLYYSEGTAGARFCFASELKALAAMPGFEDEVDGEAVAEFLSLSYIPDPLSIYRAVRKLPPGHSLLVDGNGSRLRKYWEPRFGSAAGTQVEEAAEQIRGLAREAVRKRLMSDVPLGAFLSGGVDSSGVVAFMAGAAPGRVKTFSIGFTDKTYDELRYAQQIVQRYGTDHYQEVVTPSVEEMLGVLAGQFDEPFGDPSAIPMLYLARMTRRHVKVALSGDGADEIFGGYRRYYWAMCEERLRALFPDWFRATVIRFGARHYPSFEYMPRVFRARSTLNFLSKELGDAYFTHMSAFRDDDAAGCLSAGLRASLGGYSPRQQFRQRFVSRAHLAPLQQMQAVDLETYLPGDILVKVDRATMAFSIEARCPWLDYRIAELSCHLPPGLNLRGQAGKYAFKRAMEPYVPQELITRPKKGFAVPLASWFRTSLKPVFEALVFRQDMERYLAPGAVRNMWRQHQAGTHSHERKLWNFLMLAAWDDLHLHKRRGMVDELLAGAKA